MSLGLREITGELLEFGVTKQITRAEFDVLLKATPLFLQDLVHVRRRRLSARSARFARARAALTRGSLLLRSAGVGGLRAPHDGAHRRDD